MSQYIRYPSLAGTFITTTLTASHILVGNGSNIATDVAVSGDLTLATSGAFTVVTVGGSTAAAIHNTVINNTTDVTLTAVGAVPNANGASLSGQALTLQPANTSFPGVLLAADWNTFNSKQSALTIGNLSDAGTDGIVITNGGGSVIGTGTSLAQHVADASHNGYLSSSDWSSFNGKISSVTLTVPAASLFGVTGSGTAALGITTTGTSGGIPYFSSTTALSSSALLTANALVLGGGAATAPVALGSLGSTTTVLHGNAAGAPTFGAVSLTADVSGILPIANGGTNSGATATAGGVSYGTGSALAFTAAGSSGQYLKSNASSAPAFASFTAPTVQKFTSGTGTYTSPAGVLYVRLIMVGGGGGGAGSGTSPAAAVNGVDTTFGSIATAGGGVKGIVNSSGGAGGAATLTGPTGIDVNGGAGMGYGNSTTAVSISTANGGSSALGGAGSGGIDSTAGSAGAAGTGGGGGGGGGKVTTTVNSAGGGSGAYINTLVTSGFSGGITYAVGAGGAGGGAGTGGFAGGAGGAGQIVIEEYYS